MKNILMNVEMTKAILDGRKVQTRRVMPIEANKYGFDCLIDEGAYLATLNPKEYPTVCIKPKYQIGETIWVREPVKIDSCNHRLDNGSLCHLEYFYKSDEDYERRVSEKIDLPERLFTDIGNPPKWALNRQSIPNGCIKEMARIFLRITDVRVERLQDISEEDIKKEGWSDKMALEDYADIYKEYGAISAQRAWWIKLWDNTAPKDCKYKDNPYVFVYEFEKGK